MDEPARTAAVEANAALLADAARAAGMDTRVPTCPDWAVSDLVEHLGLVHLYVRGIVETEAQEFPGRPSRPEGKDLLGWFEEGAQGLVRALSRVDPGARVWNWAAAAPAPVGFWHRRMAHETVVHRVDADSAAGRRSRVEPPELAADGLDELFELMRIRMPAVDRPPFEGTFHFHATDVEGEWHLRLASGELEIRREHAKADLAVRGPASELELFAYNRGPADRLELLGATDLLEEWRLRMRF